MDDETKIRMARFIETFQSDRRKETVMPQLGIRSYPDVLREKPNEYEVEVLDTRAVILDDGTYYTIILENKRRIVGLVPWEAIFKPDIKVVDRLASDTITGCISIEQVIEECLPGNYRLTAQQQAKLPRLIANAVDDWQAANPVEEVDTSKIEKQLAKIEKLQKKIYELEHPEE